jgi:hypothetical protein
MTRHLPDIAAINGKLASQNRRVETFLDEVLARLDQLIDAALAHDWEAVRRWSGEIAHCSHTSCDSEILRSAQSVLEAADQRGNEAELKSRVLKLIVACGRVRERAKMP